MAAINANAMMMIIILINNGCLLVAALLNPATSMITNATKLRTMAKKLPPTRPITTIICYIIIISTCSKAFEFSRRLSAHKPYKKMPTEFSAGIILRGLFTAFSRVKLCKNHPAIILSHYSLKM